jgi:hypothetical protein
MTIDTNSVIMVGATYDECLKVVSKNILDKMIYEDKLSVGSIYFDSTYSENIVGKVLVSTEDHTAIDFFDLETRRTKAVLSLPEEFLTINFISKLNNYLTLVIY